MVREENRRGGGDGRGGEEEGIWETEEGEKDWEPA